MTKLNIENKIFAFKVVITECLPLWGRGDSVNRKRRVTGSPNWQGCGYWEPSAD